MIERGGDSELTVTRCLLLWLLLLPLLFSPSASPSSASANPADAQSAQDLTLFVRTSATGSDGARIDGQRMRQWLIDSLCIPLGCLSLSLSLLRCKICCSRWSVAVDMTRGAAIV